MPPIIVEPDKKAGGFKATHNGRQVAHGETQHVAGQAAHDKKPDISVVAARVRDTDYGHRDEFRHMFGPKPE